MSGCVYKTEKGKCLKFSETGVISYCVEGPCEYETPSNADRIRGMSDEELAELFAAFETRCYMRIEPLVSCDTENFKRQHLEWLKSPAEEVDE